MVNIKPDIVRRIEIGKNLKLEIEKRNLKITELSKKMGLKSHNSISNALNGTIPGSDNLLDKIANNIGLKHNEYLEIRKKASKIEYEFEFGENISENKDDLLAKKAPSELLDEVISLNFRHSGINNKKAEEEAKSVIEFIINKYHQKK